MNTIRGRFLAMTLLAGAGCLLSLALVAADDARPATSAAQGDVLTARMTVNWQTDSVRLSADLKKPVKILRLDTGSTRPADALLNVRIEGDAVTVSGRARSLFAALAPQTRSLWLAGPGGTRVRLDLPPLDIRAVSLTQPDASEKGLFVTLDVDGLLPGFALSCAPQADEQSSAPAPVLVRTDSTSVARLQEVSAQGDAARLQVLLHPTGVGVSKATYRFTIQNRDGSQSRSVSVQRAGNQLREDPLGAVPARPAAVDAPVDVPAVELREVSAALAAVRKAGLVPVLFDLTHFKEVPEAGLEKQPILRQGLAPGNATRQGAMLLLGVQKPGLFQPSPEPVWTAPPAANEPGGARPQPPGGLAGAAKPPAVDLNAIDIPDEQGFVNPPPAVGGLTGAQAAPAEPGLTPGGGQLDGAPFPTTTDGAPQAAGTPPGTDKPAPPGAAAAKPAEQAVVPIKPDPGVNIDPARPPQQAQMAAMLKQVLQALTMPGASKSLPGPLAKILNEAIDTIENDLIDSLEKPDPIERVPADRVLGVIRKHLVVSLKEDDRQRALAAWQDAFRTRLNAEMIDRNKNTRVSDDVVVWFILWLHRNGLYDPARDMQVVKGANGEPVAVLSDKPNSPSKKDPPAIALGPKTPPTNTSVAVKPADVVDVSEGKVVSAPVIPQGIARTDGSSLPDKVRVPQLAGTDDALATTYKEAVAKLARVGLKPQVRQTTVQPADPVFEQDPKPSTFVAIGTPVTLTFGVRVPDVTTERLTRDEVEKKLRDVGLKSKATAKAELTDNPKDNGLSWITEQSPKADQVVPRGSEIAITVATYKYQAGAEAPKPATPAAAGMVRVPNLVSKFQDVAEKALTKVGLKFELRDLKTEETTDMAAGGKFYVTAQSVAANQSVAAGTVVKVDVVQYILKDDPLRTVPLLLGLAPAVADTVLKKAGLNGKVVETVPVETPNANLKDQTFVAKVTPRPGMRVPADTVIEVTLGQYVYKDTGVVVPPLVNKTVQQADFLLKRAGIKGRTRSTKQMETDQADLIGKAVVVNHSQKDNEGKAIPRDQVIEIDVVQYTEVTVQVPQLINLYVDKLPKDFKIQIRGSKAMEAPDPKAVGYKVVVGQAPPPGAKMPRSGTILIDVVVYVPKK